MIKKIMLIASLCMVGTMLCKELKLTYLLHQPLICGTHTLITGTDLAQTGSLFGFGQAIQEELCSFLNVLTADRHVFKNGI
ncbi:MAG: hypothetical protein L7F78_08010 [Syntrophales bacterium LBB04]|nr:hypothetical protein [Syntrophales bacterium LBB04]